MLNRTRGIRQQMLSLEDSKDRLQLLKNKYEGETAYIVATGPSLRNHKSEKMIEYLSDKFVIGIKQAYDVLGDVIDVHMMNFCNCKFYDYMDNNSTIVSWIVAMQDQPNYIIQNNMRCDFMMPLTRNHAGHENTLASKRDFHNMLISKSFERPWGSGIMYEGALPMAIHCGSKRIVTLGWDIGDLKEDDEGKSFIKYDHFYAHGEDMQKTEYDGVNVQKLGVGGSSGMSFDETKMVVDSTEDLHYFLESIDVDLNICSDRNPAFNKIKRIEFQEI